MFSKRLHPTFCTTPKTSSVKEAATKRDKPDVKDDKSNTSSLFKYSEFIANDI